MEVIKGVNQDIPFFVPKFIFYIKRRKLLYINKIHFFYNFIHTRITKFDKKNGWTQRVHPSNKRTRLKVLEGVDQLYCKKIIYFSSTRCFIISAVFN